MPEPRSSVRVNRPISEVFDSFSVPELRDRAVGTTVEGEALGLDRAETRLGARG